MPISSNESAATLRPPDGAQASNDARHWERGLGRKLRVLHVEVHASEITAPYNEHCLPLADEREISICSFYPIEVARDPRIAYYDGDGSLLGFAALLRRIVRERSLDLIHLHSPHVAALFLLVSLIDARVRAARPHTLYTAHNSFNNYRPRNQLLMLPVFAFVRRVICCSESSLASFPSLYKVLAGERLFAAPNGMDITRVDDVCAAPADPRFTLISVGRVVRIKNPFTLLTAFLEARLADARLIFLGDGELREELARRAQDQPVEVRGLAPRQEALATLKAAQVFVSTSYGEGLPIATLEAMAAGCAVVLSDIPPHRELARGVDFIPLIPCDDHEGFAREIRRIHALGPEGVTALGARCRALVEARFSLEAMHAAYAPHYRALAQEPGAGERG